MIINKKCPICMAEVQFDDSREFMFCQYCGVKIMNDNYRAPASPNTPGFATAPPKTTTNAGFATAPPKVTPNPGFATAPPKGAPNAATVANGDNQSNVFINFRTTNLAYVLQTSIDNRMITQFRNGDTVGFALTPGKHFVKFRIGSRRYMRPIMITDANTKVYINYSYDGTNNIDITF